MATGEEIHHFKKLGSRHPNKKLTAAFVKSINKPGYDADGNGLNLRVEESGTRRWVQRLFIYGSPRMPGLGGFPFVSLAEACEKALSNRKIARKGGDPIAEKRKQMKGRRFHRVPLSPRALDIPRKAQSISSSHTTLVFPGASYKKPLSDATLSKLVRELGIAARPHGFRASFRCWAAGCTKTPREVAEAALAHVVKEEAEAAYARSDLFEKRRKLMDEWSEYLLS